MGQERKARKAGGAGRAEKLLDRLREAVDAALRPAPQPQLRPIPVRSGDRRAPEKTGW